MLQVRGFRRQIAVVFGVVAVMVCGLAAVAVGSRSLGSSSQDRLARAGETAAETGSPLDLGILTGERWDRVGVFSDYDDRTSVEQTLRVSWPGGRWSFRGRDYTFHIVFARGRDVVAHATVDGLVACLIGSDAYARGARFPARVVEDDVVQVFRPGGDC